MVVTQERKEKETDTVQNSPEWLWGGWVSVGLPYCWECGHAGPAQEPGQWLCLLVCYWWEVSSQTVPITKLCLIGNTELAPEMARHDWSSRQGPAWLWDGMLMQGACGELMGMPSTQRHRTPSFCSLHVKNSYYYYYFANCALTVNLTLLVNTWRWPQQDEEMRTVSEGAHLSSLAKQTPIKPILSLCCKPSPLRGRRHRACQLIFFLAAPNLSGVRGEG